MGGGDKSCVKKDVAGSVWVQELPKVFVVAITGVLIFLLIYRLALNSAVVGTGSSVSRIAAQVNTVENIFPEQGVAQEDVVTAVEEIDKTLEKLEATALCSERALEVLFPELAASKKDVAARSVEYVELIKDSVDRVSAGEDTWDSRGEIERARESFHLAVSEYEDLAQTYMNRFWL